MSHLFEARGVGKRYRVRGERSIALGLLRGAGVKDVWALRDLDLDVDGGEVVAVVGRNGAGKSTVLKLAAGVTTPTTGTMHRPDRIAPLIEVGAGFHPELTGRENVDVNARLLGVGSKEIRRSFDDIVAFAELSHAIDQPVRQYSSGMFMRLGFSVAIHTRPELLIVDEVLAVGDLPFQVRCLDRIREMRKDGVGVLFVSHNLTAVMSLADRAILLSKGEVIAEGTPTDVVGAYHQSMAEVPNLEQVGEDGAQTPQLELEELTVLDDAGLEPALWYPGQRATLRFRLRALTDSPEGILALRFVKDGAGMVARWIAEDGPFVPALRAGDAADVTATVALNVGAGGYFVDIAVGPQDYRGLLLSANGAFRFGVADRKGATGIVDLDPTLDVGLA